MSTRVHIEVAETGFDPEAAHLAFRNSLGGTAGAICAFTGIVRASSSNEDVDTLELQHYPGFTQKQMQRIAEGASARWPLDAVSLIHRSGVMAPGEPIVFVATASKHRRAAFEAADYLMDYLKSDAPFWKKERRADGTHWIEPRDQDYADKARWSVTDGDETHAGD